MDSPIAPQLGRVAFDDSSHGIEVGEFPVAPDELVQAAGEVRLQQAACDACGHRRGAVAPKSQRSR